jgi:site-specific DNA recombinase
MREASNRPQRCAIYTRKSTDEGLDQAFNSLDAQREACAAYVVSQAHEGWRLDNTVYDDGGFSGGTLERPALKQLLTEVRAGRIDVIVVYKVDRLTRSLADFAKIVEILDAAGASFVSITQSFNTTTSMGRLTLNVLLSFAQFEREVISERVRDKVAASKAKGIWMGGNLPLGYRVEARKLLPVQDEVETIRHIMRTYLNCRSIRHLSETLKAQGVISKALRRADGSVRGGIPLETSPLFYMLKNRIYIGEIVHKGRSYPGEHEPIVDAELFAAVQSKLAQAAADKIRGPRKSSPSLLMGRIQDHLGRSMTPTHSVKAKRRYRYYTSFYPDSPRRPFRLPAEGLDAAVVKSIATFFRDDIGACEAAAMLDVQTKAALETWSRSFALGFETLDALELMHRFTALDLRVSTALRSAEVSFSWSAALNLAQIAGGTRWSGERISIRVGLDHLPYGQEPRVRIAPEVNDNRRKTQRLVDLIVSAIAARDQLLVQPDSSGRSATVRHLQRTARLAYLDPKIIAAILEGDPRITIGARPFSRLPSFPLSWEDQRRLVGII